MDNFKNMVSKIKILLLVPVFILSVSCGWLEEEEVREATIGEYKVFYDKKNIAYTYFDVLKSNGGSILHNCITLTLAGDTLYAMQIDKYENDAIKYFKIDHITKRVTSVSQAEYRNAVSQCKNCDRLDYYELSKLDD